MLYSVYKVQPVDFWYAASNVPSSILRWSTLGLFRMNFHSCEQKWMFKIVPCKFHLQTLRFGVKFSMCFCSETDASTVDPEEWCQKWNCRKRNCNCEAYSVYESERCT